MAQLRMKEIQTPQDVEYAILENNQIPVFPLRRADCVKGNGQKACAIRYVRTARAGAYGRR